MTKHLVVVAGNLGTGKTALVEQVGECLNWHIVYESVIDNPYLADFYANMSTWAFHLQVYFLGHRAKQHLQAAAMRQSAIMDRSIYEDANVFARALHHLGHITERDYSSYLQVFDVVVRSLPPPDLLIYLKAPLRVLVQRIQMRGLEFDYRGITEEYLALIDSFYEEWIQVFDICPVLTIDTENSDYVNDTGCLEIIVGNILRMVAKEEAIR
ncbi:deoxynucleoside kinase [Dehalococcoidia bacterium]|nr:deoxynucleoside kinase [Dehalococcoidia bacterium]MCL0070640.1 deoxynucleoside kinase [Dehalococcoidia bacterium]MCL0092331.1 deoxynucleoside kinase [Dehalococcoidia bacterium]